MKTITERPWWVIYIILVIVIAMTVIVTPETAHYGAFAPVMAVVAAYLEGSRKRTRR